MDVQTDQQLLRAWVDRRDRDAVGELIRRHINFVHTTARRQVRDTHLAEDVTQAVFILMLQKAHKIRSEANMASWLFVTTRFAAANATRNVRRREYYEQHAASQARIASEGDFAADNDAELQPLLNEAIHRLPKTDRAAVVMSFLQQRTHRQVAKALGMSEDAARMRVSRAVKKMRDFFAGRGVNIGDAALGATMLKQTTASTALIRSTVNVAILSQSAAGAGPASMLAKAVSKMLLATKVKLAAMGAALVIGAGLVAGQAARETTGSPPAAAPTTNAADASMSVSLGDGVIVRFLGAAPFPAAVDQWRSFDGKPMRRPDGGAGRFGSTGSPMPTMQTAVRVTAPADADIQMQVQPAAGAIFEESRNVGNDTVLSQAFGLRHGAATFEIEISIADGPWETVAKLDDPNRQGMTGMGNAKYGGVTFTPLMVGANGEVMQFISAEFISIPWRVIYTDIGGAKHEARRKMGSGAGRMRTGQFAYDLPMNQIASVQLQVHPMRKRVVAGNLSADPAKPSAPQITTPKVDQK